MRRRHFVASSAVVATGLTGCMDLLGGTDDRDDPEAVVREFVAAMDEGDRKTANDLIHGDSPEGEVSEAEAERTAELEVTLEETELLEENDDTARVRVELTLSDGTNTQTRELIYELRTEDGDWKVWEERSADDSAEPERPQAAVTIDSDTEENTITVKFVANNNADYVEATVDADDAPGWEDDGRLEEVGGTDTFRAGSDGSYPVTVTAHKGDQSAVLLEETVEL